MTRKLNKSVAVGGAPPPLPVVGFGVEEAVELGLGDNNDDDMGSLEKMPP
jgi:hypothetical protein